MLESLYPPHFQAVVEAYEKLFHSWRDVCAGKIERSEEEIKTLKEFLTKDFNAEKSIPEDIIHIGLGPNLSNDVLKKLVDNWPGTLVPFLKAKFDGNELRIPWDPPALTTSEFTSFRKFI